MSRGHSQGISGSCRARAANSHGYELHRRRNPRPASSYSFSVAVEPCSFLSGAITGAASVATFPRQSVVHRPDSRSLLHSQAVMGYGRLVHTARGRSAHSKD